jgi:hypothetical protein
MPNAPPPPPRSYGPIKAEYDTSRRTITRTNYEVGGAGGWQPLRPAR